MYHHEKVFILAAIVGAFLIVQTVTASAETIAKDTVAYTGAWKMEKVQKTNDYGEISVRYVLSARHRELEGRAAQGLD